MKIRWISGQEPYYGEARDPKGKQQGDVINAVVVDGEIRVVIKGEDSLIHIVRPEDIVP